MLLFYSWQHRGMMDLDLKIIKSRRNKIYIQGVIESCTNILTTSYWLHVELGKNIKKILYQKIK
jgi:hypothetical protein